MSNDRPEDQTPNQTENDIGNMAVDDMGIPILQEIISPMTDARPETKDPVKTSSGALKRALTVPHNEILAKALRNQLRSKVKKDLDDIANDVAVKVVSDITPELEQKIRSQVTEILDRNMDVLIEKIITEIPKRV